MTMPVALQILYGLYTLGPTFNTPLAWTISILYWLGTFAIVLGIGCVIYDEVIRPWRIANRRRQMR